MIHKSMLAAATASALLLTSYSQLAAARDFADIYTECGLGSLIAPKNGAVAAVTNVTWDLGTTAISSNISSPDSCKGGQDKKAAFLHETYPQIEKDLAQGEGKHLATLLTLSGCSPDIHRQLSTALRGDFAHLVAAPGYSAQTRYEQAKTLFDTVNQRIARDFSHSCSSI